MKILCPLYFLILIFSLSSGSIAQTQQVKFDLVTGKNGISLGQITSIAQDPYGVMWFTDQTNRCITRYDGNTMTKYQHDPKNPNSPAGIYPEFIMSDPSGILWIGYYGMGFDKFDPATNNFTHFQHRQNDSQSLANDTVPYLLLDHLGNLWVATYRGLDLLDQKTGKFKHYAHDPRDSTSLSWNRIRILYEDHQGNLWIGTGLAWDPNNEGGLNRFNRATGTFTRYMNDPGNSHSLINNKVRAIFEDSQGTFWVGTLGDGLHTMDRKTGLFERHLYDSTKPGELSRPALKDQYDHITFITEDAEKNLWIGTFGNGLNRYDPLTKKVTHFAGGTSKTGPFKDNSVWWAFPSSNGLLWVSTQELNTYKIDIYHTEFTFHSTGTLGLNYIYEETPTILWFATDNGLVRNDLKTGSAQRFMHDPQNPTSLNSKSTGVILKNSQGNLLVCTWGGGLNIFNQNTQTFTHLQHDPNNDESLINDTLISVYEDRDLNLWVSTFSHGFDMIDRKTGKFMHHQNDPLDTNTVSENFVVLFTEDGPDDLWLSTGNYGGINKLNRKTGKFTHYLLGNSTPIIYKSSNGTIWAGGDEGLYRYDKKLDDFTIIDHEITGENIKSIRSIIEDNNKNLWIGSTNGIYMFNPGKNQMIYYGRDNGINAGNLNYSGSNNGHAGQIYFAANSGYYEFYPGRIKINLNPAKIYFNNFWLNGKLIKPGLDNLLQQPLIATKQIHLNYDQNIFSFSFSVIDYDGDQDKTTYYELENYDKNWRASGPENRVYYFNVPPGKYTFRIKSINHRNGLWEEKNIVILISPPWWKTWWAYLLFGLLLAASMWGIIYYRSRTLRRQNKILEEKVEHRTAQLKTSLEDLKSTQTQLIQREKMASLGELTAGIAHEIQNPLNFVNNFSEVNTELIDEMKQELKTGNVDAAINVANDIQENNVKITEHGKRADGIVKGMLQHSRTSASQKEPTDINALADEYLRLSYHGLRAKDKTFNSAIQTDFDESLSAGKAGIGLINIIPQEIGRVLLNLFTNAFYAVSEKSNLLHQTTNGESKTDKNYEPLVSVSTKRNGNQVLITVMDNGNGIPEKVIDKIFQPFFTTKPAGQGTGLGLSLSYDIIKAHSGEIKVETKEGEGTTFVIQLPF
ncbi:MAG: two-component regulator propeller domain-containing protein [Ginsengibacter sp.]